MKLILQNIKQLKQKTDNALTKKVCNYIISHWQDYEDKQDIFTDVLNYGCQSGTVSELIYYSDTNTFFKTYREEIASLIYDPMVGTQIFTMKELFGKKYDETDPLINDFTNQNLLAWFGFEETLRNIGLNFEVLKEKI